MDKNYIEIYDRFRTRAERFDSVTIDKDSNRSFFKGGVENIMISQYIQSLVVFMITVLSLYILNPKILQTTDDDGISKRNRVRYVISIVMITTFMITSLNLIKK